MSTKFEKLVSAAKDLAARESRKEGSADAAAWLLRNPEKTLSELFKKQNRRISERTKILAYCVAAGLTSKESNRLLRSQHREELYIRNLSDIAVMRILDQGRSAEELCGLMEKLSPLSERVPCADFFARAGSGKFICTVEMMEAYLDHSRIKVPILEMDLSDEAIAELERQVGVPAGGAPLFEKKITRQLTDELKSEFDMVLDQDDEAFLRMVEDKIDMFSVVRDRTRREFVRHLCEYARAVIRSGSKEALLELFMNVDTIDEPEKRPISFKDLAFDVNEFYDGRLFGVEEHEYASEDQLDFEPLSSREERKAWVKQSEKAEDVEREAARKKCATLLQGLLQGKNDISRTLFVAFLLFFNAKRDAPLSIQQLNGTLSKCGWRQIDVQGDDAFDRLAVDILDYYSEKDIPYATFLDIMLQDLEEDAFGKYEGDDANLTRTQAVSKTLR